jgi:hypothetical protein
MKIRVLLAFCGVFALSASMGMAQDQDKPETHKKVRTIKGCLSKADDAKEYNLTGTDGSTWEVKSDSVKLSSHVGHVVEVTGVVSNAAAYGAKEDAKDEAREHGVDKDSTEHGHLTATNLKMVSKSCDK